MWRFADTHPFKIYISRKYSKDFNSTKTLPYLQVFILQNQPLKSLIRINLYMPIHPDDLPIIPLIKKALIQTIKFFLASNVLLCSDFNRDIAIIGYYHNDLYYPFFVLDYLWKTYITSNNLDYIATDTTYSRQGDLGRCTLYTFCAPRALMGYFLGGYLSPR